MPSPPWFYWRIQSVWHSLRLWKMRSKAPGQVQSADCWTSCFRSIAVWYVFLVIVEDHLLSYNIGFTWSITHSVFSVLSVLLIVWTSDCWTVCPKIRDWWILQSFIIHQSWASVCRRAYGMMKILIICSLDCQSQQSCHSPVKEISRNVFKY